MTVPAPAELYAAALERVLEWEGVYSATPGDPGGETVFGVARRRWPSWAGWARVDALRGGAGWPRSLSADRELRRLVSEFYVETFWRPLECDRLAAGDPALAVKVFDAGVNVGRERVAELLQGTLRAFGRADVWADGRIGPVTVAAVRELCATAGGAAALLAALRSALRAYYVGLMRGNPSLEKFRRGWLRRAEA